MPAEAQVACGRVTADSGCSLRGNNTRGNSFAKDKTKTKTPYTHNYNKMHIRTHESSQNLQFLKFTHMLIRYTEYKRMRQQTNETNKTTEWTEGAVRNRSHCFYPLTHRQRHSITLHNLTNV